MDEIASLRQQLSAAEFLANTVRAKLEQAEEQYAATQQFHHHHDVPRTRSTPQTHHPSQENARHSTLDPTLRPPRNATADLVSTANAQETPPLDAYDDAHDEDAATPPSADADPSSPEQPVVECVEYPVPEGTRLPDLTVKTLYPSLAAVKTAVETYALLQGWTAATKKRDRLRICMGCRSTRDCPFHVRAETCAEGARISASKFVHNCLGTVGSGEAPPKRHHHSRLRFLREEVPKLMEVSRTTPTKAIQECVFQRFGTRITLSQCAKLRGPIGRPKKMVLQGCSRCGGSGHNRLTCTAEQVPEGMEGG